MTDYRYRVQVGNEYTYRETGSELDDLIRDLTLGNDVYERLGGLLAKAKGIDPPQKRRTAKFEEIKITVEEYTPPKEGKWHKCQD